MSIRTNYNKHSYQAFEAPEDEFPLVYKGRIFENPVELMNFQKKPNVPLKRKVEQIHTEPAKPPFVAKEPKNEYPLVYKSRIFETPGELMDFQKKSKGQFKHMNEEKHAKPAQAPFIAEEKELTPSLLPPDSNAEEKTSQLFLKNFRLIRSSGSSHLMKIISETIKEYQAELKLTNLSVQEAEQLNVLEMQTKKTGSPSNISLVKLPDSLGFGVFLNSDASAIEEGQVVGIYAGIYTLNALGSEYAFDTDISLELTPKEVKKIPFLDGEEREFELHIDATNSGNFTRFFNHSLLNCNAKTKVVIMPDGLPEILIVATQKIHPGEQIVISYFGNYWKRKNIIPECITPNTYTINILKQVVMHPERKDLYSTIENRLHLLQFRRPLAKNDEFVLNDFKSTDSKPLKKIFRQYIEEIYEQGISSPFSLMKLPGTSEWGVFLKPNRGPLQPETFIGIFGGTYKVHDGDTKSPSAFVQKFSKSHSEQMTGSPSLIVEVCAENKGNFTREIKHSTQPNVYLKSGNFGSEGYQIVLYAKKMIAPGEQLLLYTGNKVKGIPSMTASTFKYSPAE